MAACSIPCTMTGIVAWLDILKMHRPFFAVEKYFVQNFGCRATQADGAALESMLAGKGLVAAEERVCADLVVLNTCTVTAAADDDVRQTIRRVHRENPETRILVTGCYAQRAPEELAA